MRKSILSAILVSGLSLSIVTPSTAFASTQSVSTKAVLTSTHQTHPATKSAYTYAIIRSGDSLWGLATRYGVTVRQLEVWNGLTSHSLLKIGERIIVGVGRVNTMKSTTLSGRSQTTFTASAGAGLFGEQVVTYGAQFLGVPYRWGGESPSGFDCSGFVRFTYGHFGVYLGRDSFSQFTEGTAVSRANLLPGDLVFFDTDGGGASHVGIYAGGDRFINAAGDCVKYSSLDDGYWGAHYIGARRVH